MMFNVRLYLPSIILLSWAVLWGAGLRGDAVIVGGLVSTAVAVLVAELERRRLRAVIAGAGGEEHPSPRSLRELSRDLALIFIAAVVAWAAVETQGLVDDLADTRETSIRDSCRDDQAQDNVLRALLIAALETPDPNSPYTPQEARKLTEELLAPLGGLAPTEAELEARCDRRIERGTP